ncbi:MAG TPA: helix-turn-helix transcriptional regulator [Aquabacterium sp.]|uniref:helix-turn-helix domain-containing protein n=1 Tax=Aquabacterium sp. TaxID=1872578 RepID=UPI002E336153|nr:helix-turn-helix transcriptional regulator [Aquabacterium sp.]HEX5372812.1 helix-turn-helix transcriptional regulator [Aquabacterium sp.]
MDTSTPDTPLPPPTAAQAELLWERTRKALRGNLVRVLSVSREGGEGATRMTQTELTSLTGIARSTLAKFLSSEDESVINPDLQTLCRLAEALNIPPALLLMSTHDWSRLLSAISGLLAQREHKDVMGLDHVAHSPPRENVVRAVQLARHHGLLLATASTPAETAAWPELAPRWRRDIDDLRQRQLQGIKAASALPEWRAIPANVEALFVLCTLLGAATNL